MSQNHLNSLNQISGGNVSRNKRTHHRTRSVDLRLLSSTNISSPAVAAAAATTSEHSSLSGHFLASIEEKVAKLYYKHGLFCSRHSLFVILLSLAVVVCSSFQIFTYRGIFGSSAEVYTSSDEPIQFGHFTEPATFNETGSHSETIYKYLNFWKNSDFENEPSVPRWFHPNLSYAFVQRIFIRTAVLPWSSELQLVDALRGPLQLVFELVESISNYQLQNNHTESINLNDVCFQVFEPILSRRYSHLFANLPSYSCLLLSPANVWNGDWQHFSQDGNFLDTLLRFQNGIKSPLPAGEMHNILYGVNFAETGFRHTYGRSRVRTITYSITLTLRRHIPGFIEGLREFLAKRYPLYPSFVKQQSEAEKNQFENLANKQTRHIFYHNTFTFNYLIPLFLFYTLVCLYMYFSVRKIELVRNKFLYALCALITVLLSLFMAFGICFRFGFNSVLIVNRLLPYFVAGISFENMLVLTKSVLANPQLDTKVRVAQGLSREGLSITKNLCAELTLLTIGSLTFDPFFKECCILAAVCLVSDFFIQITFFTAFFSIDIQRINERSIKKYPNNHKSYPKNIYAQPGRPVKKTTPKRLRFIYFLARIRIVQRGFILLLCACIGLAIYNAYLVLDQQLPSTVGDSFIQNGSRGFHFPTTTTTTTIATVPASFEANTEDQQPKLAEESLDKQQTLIELLKSTSSEHQPPISKSESYIPFERILFTSKNPLPTEFPNYYWANLFSLYNISLVGRFISILPPILLSIPVPPEKAISVRNLADSDYEMLKRFVPMKFSNGEYVISVDDDIDMFDESRPLAKSDFLIILGLSIPSVIFLVYLFILMYRCVCTRNYAEWRSQVTSTYNPFRFIQSNLFQRFTSESEMPKLFRFDISLLTETETYKNENHFLLNNQDVNLLMSNTQTTLVASSSMTGDIRVYDALTCEPLTYIQRSKSNSEVTYFNSNFIDDSITNPSPPASSVMIAKTSGSLLKTIVDGISVENDVHEEDYEDEQVVVMVEKPLGELHFTPIWCLDIFDRYILAGCSDGRLEVWDAHTAVLAFIFSPEHLLHSIETVDNETLRTGVTAMKVTYWGVVLARLNGILDLLLVEQDSPTLGSSRTTIRYQLKQTLQAHKQPIVRLEIIDSLEDEEFIQIFGSRGCLITGSLDTTLKVFSLDQGKFMYTLNGHCGAIMITSIDQFSTAAALSGCQLGQLCVWDLNTGTCIFSMQAHSNAEVLAITASPLYYVTSGTDNRVCVWDRYSGHLVHSISQQHSICRNLVFIETGILVTTREGELIVWDVNEAQQLCIFSLATTNSQKSEESKRQSWIRSYQASSIKNLLFTYQRKALICDYGNSLYVINNPFALKKLD